MTVPAGETVVYMQFGSMQLDNAAAAAAAVDLSSLQVNEIFQGSFTSLFAWVQNWDLTDGDGDGAPGAWESLWGLSDANAADADNDDDGDEVNTHGTDPLAADTDGDGLSDSGEVNAGLDPLTPEISLAGQQLSDGVLDGTRADVAIDSAGNRHIAWGEGCCAEIYYKLLDSNFNTLIDQTPLTGGSECAVRPKIALGSDGRVFILRQDECSTFGMPSLHILDPSADDQNGDAADPVALTVAEVPVLGGSALVSYASHPEYVLDSSDNLHIAYQERRPGGPAAYTKLDRDGNELVAPVQIGLTLSHATFGIGLDSNENVHISWTDGSLTVEDELFYIMLNGSDGGTMIGLTMLTPDDMYRAKHTNLIVDNDLVTIIWGDARMTGGVGITAEEVFLMRLDPGLDDQNGNAADPAVIKTVPDTRISADDSVQSWYISALLGADGNVDVTWQDAGGCSAGTIKHLRTDLSGNVIAAERVLTTDGDVDTCNAYVGLAGGDAYTTEMDGSGVSKIIRRPLIANPAVASSSGTGTTTVTVDSGILVSLEALALTDLPAAAQAEAPSDASFDDGLYRLIIDGVAVGGTVNVTLAVPTAFDAASDIYYKWDLANGWQSHPATNGADMNEIVLALTDGGAGDADGVANGQIVDPGGPGQVAGAGGGAGSAPPQSSDDNWFGCSTGSGDGPVDPTLPLLLVISLLYLTRRRWMRAWQG